MLLFLFVLQSANAGGQISLFHFQSGFGLLQRFDALSALSAEFLQFTVPARQHCQLLLRPCLNLFQRFQRGASLLNQFFLIIELICQSLLFLLQFCLGLLERFDGLPALRSQLALCVTVSRQGI